MTSKVLLPYTTLEYYGEAAGAMLDTSTGTSAADIQGWGRAQGGASGVATMPTAHVTGLKNRPMTAVGLGQIVTAYPRGKARPILTVSIGARPSAEDVAQAVWGMDNGIETGWTPRQVMRILAAVMAGKVTGADLNAPVFRSITDTEPRVTASTDASGNRSTVTLNPD